MSWPMLCSSCGGSGEITTCNDLGDEFSTDTCYRCAGSGVKNFDGDAYYERARQGTEGQRRQKIINDAIATIQKIKGKKYA